MELNPDESTLGTRKPQNADHWDAAPAATGLAAVHDLRQRQPPKKGRFATRLAKLVVPPAPLGKFRNLVACLLLLVVCVVTDGPVTQADVLASTASTPYHYEFVESRVWSPPAKPDAIPIDLAFATEERLIVIRDDNRPDPAYRAFILDAEGNDLGDWTAPTDTARWMPMSVASVVDESVFLGSGDAPVHVYSAAGVYGGVWAAGPGDEFFPQRLRSASDGTLFGVTGFVFGPWSVYRWHPDGTHAGSWGEGEPGRPAASGLRDVTIDSAGDMILVARDGRFHRASPSGRSLSSFDVRWPPELGPPEDGHDVVVPEGIGFDRWNSELLLYDEVQQGRAAHVLRTGENGEYHSAVQLWRFRNGRPTRTVSPTARSDGFALPWTPSSRVAIADADFGVTQFRSDGSLSAVTRMMATKHRSTVDPPEVWSRVRIGDASSSPTLLSARSERLGRLDSDKESWSRAAIPFAMDLSSSEDVGTVVRGWDGIDGRVARYDTDGSRMWDVRCECPLSTGITHDEERVYVADVVAGRILSFDIRDGSPLGALEHATDVRTSLIDLASLGDGRLALLHTGGRIRVMVHGAPGAEAEWFVHSASEPVAIAGGSDRVVALFADATIEVWTTDGQFVDRWSVEDDGVEAPSDIAMNSDDGSVRVIGEGGVTARYAPVVGERAIGDVAEEPGDESCAIEGSASAEPTLVSPNDLVGVTISVAGDCLAHKADADVIIAWDASRSFWYYYEYERARETVDQLVRLLDWPGIRVEIVIAGPSDEGGETLVPFGTAVEAAIEGVSTYHRTDFEQYGNWNKGKPDWPDLVKYAHERLATAARPEAERFVILVGQPFATTVVDSAVAFERDGGRLLMLELPTHSADHPLDAVLTAPKDRLLSAHAGDVARLARKIVRGARPPDLRDPVLVVRHSTDSEYKTLSAEPTAIEDVGRVAWRLGPLDVGQTVRYQVRPRGIGELQAFERATLYATQPDGVRRAFEIAPPNYTVVLIEPTPVAEGTATAAPFRSYMPRVDRSD